MYPTRLIPLQTIMEEILKEGTDIPLRPHKETTTTTSDNHTVGTPTILLHLEINTTTTHTIHQLKTDNLPMDTLTPLETMHTPHLPTLEDEHKKLFIHQDNKESILLLLEVEVKTILTTTVDIVEEVGHMISMDTIMVMIEAHTIEMVMAEMLIQLIELLLVLVVYHLSDNDMMTYDLYAKRSVKSMSLGLLFCSISKPPLWQSLDRRISRLSTSPHQFNSRSTTVSMIVPITIMIV